MTVLSALTTGFPKPLAPTKADITTIDKDSIMHCVNPAIIDGSAWGISTLKSVCKGVAPKASLTSIKSGGTPLSPRQVSRIGAATAKIIVEIRPGTSPRPKFLRPDGFFTATQFDLRSLFSQQKWGTIDCALMGSKEVLLAQLLE